MAFQWIEDWKLNKLVNGREHAVFGGSKYSPLSWKEEEFEDKADQFIRSYYAQTIGTLIHAEAKTLIDKKLKLNKSTASFDIRRTLLNAGIPEGLIDPSRYIDTLVPYVNDAIGFNMIAEKKLIPFMDNPSWEWGTCDAISYSENLHELRIHDLKTGVMPASMDQLLLYSAFFFLNYDIDPNDTYVELRIYQSGEVTGFKPTPNDILPVIDRYQKLNAFATSKYGRR